MLKNKKADASMVILIFIIIFFLAVSFLVVNFVGTKFKDIIESTPLNNTEASPEIIEGIETITTKTIDNGFLIIFAFLIIGIIISSFLIRVHVIWLFLYIIFLACGILMAIYLGNAYQKITEIAILAEAVANMPKTVWIMRHSLKVVLGMGALSMVVIFSKIFGREGYTERM